MSICTSIIVRNIRSGNRSKDEGVTRTYIYILYIYIHLGTSTCPLTTFHAAWATGDPFTKSKTRSFCISLFGIEPRTWRTNVRLQTTRHDNQIHDIFNSLSNLDKPFFTETPPMRFFKFQVSAHFVRKVRK